jgi:hypothetical protein
MKSSEPIRASSKSSRSEKQRFALIAANIAAVVLVVLPVVTAFLFVHEFGVNLAFHDQQRIIPLFEKLYSGTLGFSDLFAQHNEHRMFFPRIAMLALGSLTAYSNVAEMYFMQALMVVVLVVFWFAFRVDTRYKILLFAPVAFMLFTLRQYVSMLWGLVMANIIAILFSVLSFCLLYVCRNGERLRWAFPAALITGTVASFSFAQGLLVWPVGLIQLLLSSIGRKAKLILASVWTTVGILEWFVYFVGFESTGKRPTVSYLLTDPVSAAEYFFSLAGGALFVNSDLAFFCGLGITGLAVVALVMLYRYSELNNYSFWLALLLFGISFLLINTIGRAGEGVPGAPQPTPVTSRNATFSVLVVISLYAIFARLAVSRYSPVLFGVLGAFISVIALSIPVSYMEGIRGGVTLEQQRERLAYISYTYEDRSPQALERVFPSAEIVRSGASTLDELDYNVFAPSRKPNPPS